MSMNTVEGNVETQVLLVSQFFVKIDGMAESPFNDVGGLAIEVESSELKTIDASGREVLQNRPGLTKYGEITLKRYMTDDKTFFDWINQIREGKTTRRGGTITLVDSMAGPSAAWAFKNAWPSKWAVSDPDAGSAEPMTEDITLQIEFIERTK